MQAYVRVNLSEKETSVKRSERRLERVRAMKRSFGKIFLAVLAMVAYASRLVHKRLRQDLFECLFSFFFFFGFVFLRQGFSTQPWLSWKSVKSGGPQNLKSASLCLSSTGTKGVHHQRPAVARISDNSRCKGPRAE